MRHWYGIALPVKFELWEPREKVRERFHLLAGGRLEPRSGRAAKCAKYPIHYLSHAVRDERRSRTRIKNFEVATQ